MIALATPDLVSTTSGSQRSLSVSKDALTRIPTAHFRSLAWAQHTIAICLELIDDALAGGQPRASEWARRVMDAPDAASNVAVLLAVRDAVVADAFLNKCNVQKITKLIDAFERDVYAELAAHREHKGVDAMNDFDSAELAAGLVRIVQMHDKDTAIHLDATGALGRRIATAMALPPEQVTTIELAARLHDIGKVGIPRDLLCKPGPLNAEEWVQVRQHAEVGASVLLDTPKLAHLAPIVRAHHERLDGFGYPDRLRAHEIPLEARVIAVADAFHAMTTERPYRRSMLPNEALEVLADNVATQFDADVVEATFGLFRYVRRSRRAIA